MAAQIGIVGAGAFGTGLAVALCEAGHGICLWGRDKAMMADISKSRQNTSRLPGVFLPPALEVTHDLHNLTSTSIVLMAVPTQALRSTLLDHRAMLLGKTLVLCCKGVEAGTGFLPSQIVQALLPEARIAVLTGPSFAADIARGKPTALTLATENGNAELQHLLATPSLRLYASNDLLGAQLGGALKNVVAIAAGITIGAGLGDSARAALMTRGFAEMVRYATARGAGPTTLYGLSGFGDLVLTCTSDQSRNFRYGLAFGKGQIPQAIGTVEGVMTAHAVAASDPQADLPITRAVSELLLGETDLPTALASLMSRPLRQE